MAETTKAILVVGMHRSGTSALAGALSLLGVPLGDRLLKPGPDNPKGYWEHGDIVAVHEQLLAELGSRWDDVRALPEGWLSGEPALRAAAAIGAILERDFGGESLWAVKDPRLCRFLPLWLEVLGRMHIRPCILLIARNPSEVSASLQARNSWAPPFGEVLWLRYVTDALAASEETHRDVVLFDDLLVQPLVVAQGALTRLGVPVPELDDNLRSAVEGFVSKTSRHHQKPRMLKSGSGFLAVAHSLYEALAKVAEGAGSWVEVEKNILVFRAEWLARGALIDAMAGMAMKIAADTRKLESDHQVLASQLNAQIEWSEQAKHKQETLQAENADLSSKLTAQIQWSEQATRKHEKLQADNADLSSKLTAQIRWSEEAQKKNEALRAQIDVLSADAAKLQQAFDNAERAQTDLEKRLQLKGAELAQLASRHADLEHELRAIYASRSWRWTRMFRGEERSPGTKAAQENIEKRNTE
jgi:hypothetical protein